MKSILAGRPARVAAALIASIAAIVAVGVSTLSAVQAPARLADFDTSPMSVPTPSNT